MVPKSKFIYFARVSRFSMDFVVIANRGIIATRVVEACEKLGLKYVTLFEEPDLNTKSVARHRGRLNERSIRIKGYNIVNEYISVASHFKKQGFDVGIHPGVGFWSEDKVLEQFCEEYDIRFIGPQYNALDVFGDKIKFRELAISLGVPVMPGREVKSLEDAIVAASEVGYPAMVKAADGAGGRGTSSADNDDDISRILAQPEMIGKRAYVEKKLQNFRHIEVQIFGVEDESGYYLVSLGERDCTEQRRNQKIIELAPSGLEAGLRRRIIEAAVAIGEAVHYVNAGTVEFLVDISTGKFYAMEGNARIQVEHRITEKVTGVDLVMNQLLVAGRKKVIIPQTTVTGCAIEARVYAEDPDTFNTESGLVTAVEYPRNSSHITLDTYIRRGRQKGDGLPVGKYDSHLFNVIAYGRTKREIKQYLAHTLEGTSVTGVKTNIPYLERTLSRV